MSANRIATRKHAIGDSLANDDHRLPLRSVVRVKHSACNQWHSKSFEIVVTDGADIGFDFLARSRNWIAVDIEPGCVPGISGQDVDGSGTTDAWQRLHVGAQLIV